MQQEGRQVFPFIYEALGSLQQHYTYMHYVLSAAFLSNTDLLLGLRCTLLHITVARASPRPSLKTFHFTFPSRSQSRKQTEQQEGPTSVRQLITTAYKWLLHTRLLSYRPTRVDSLISLKELEASLGYVSRLSSRKTKQNKKEFQDSQAEKSCLKTPNTKTKPDKKPTKPVTLHNQRNVSHYSWARTSFRRWLLEHRNLGSTWSVNYGPEMEITQYGCLWESKFEAKLPTNYNLPAQTWEGPRVFTEADG